MADFPTSIFHPRDTENLPGLVRDLADKRNLYSEDYQDLGGEIEAIETFLNGTSSRHFSQEIIDALETITIPVREQMIVVGLLENYGIINILGTLVVL